MGYYSSSPNKWNIYKDSIVKVEYNARKQFNGGRSPRKNKKKPIQELHKANYVAVRDTKPVGIFCPCCYNTFATTDMYLRHKSIQIMKEEQRREKELMEVQQKTIMNSIQMDRERTLGRYVQFRRHSLSPMRTFNPGYGGGASGIASGVSIAAPPYRQPVIKESRDMSWRRKQILEQLQQHHSTPPGAGHSRPPNSRQLNRP